MSASNSKRKSCSPSKIDNDNTTSIDKSEKLITTDKNVVKHVTVLEDGHVDFIYGDANDDEEKTSKKKKMQQSIYLILTPRGTNDRTSKRRLIFIKTRIDEDGPHEVQVENMGKN